MSAPFYIVPGDAMLNEVPKPAVAWREAMILGPAKKEIFSRAFNEARAAWLGEKLPEYETRVVEYLNLKALVAQENLLLVFGREAFCQINLLTLLCALSQSGRKAPVVIRLIDEFSGNVTLREFAFVEWSLAEEWYQTLLIEGRPFSSSPLLWPELKKAAVLFLLLREEQNEITDIIEEHADLEETALVSLLLKWDRDFGLGDEYFLRLVRKHRDYLRRSKA